MNSIWVIEDGEYSDYRVVGVFSSKEAAETVRAAIRCGEIAEWPIDPAVAELNQGLKLFAIRMLRDGSVEYIAQTSFESYSVMNEPSVWRRSNAPAYKGKGVPDVMTCSVFGEDEKHAIKIANEKRLQMIALNRWD